MRFLKQAALPGNFAIALSTHQLHGPVLGLRQDTVEGRSRRTIILILGLLSTIGPFSIDMYLPGFPAIAQGLRTSVGMVQYSLSSYFIGICVGQLICGPLLDRFGRKLPLYVGLGLYILASIGCAFSQSVEMLIGFRFLQALGGCVGMVAPRAIVRDLFPVSEAPKIFAMLMLVLSVSPILAPTAGSYIIAALGWPAVFVVLAVITVAILLFAAFRLPESRQPDKDFSLRLWPIAKNYGAVLRHSQFYTYVAGAGVVSAGLYAYIAGSPAVFIQQFGVSEQQYGWIFAGMAVGLIGCAQLNGIILKWYTSRQIIRVAVVVQSVTGVLLLLGTLTGVLGLFGTVALIFPFLSCQGFIGPNGSALAMAPFKRLAGSASAMLGAVQMGLGAAASAVVGTLHTDTPLPMIGVMAACSFLGMVILFLGTGRLVRRERKAALADTEEQAFEMMEKY